MASLLIGISGRKRSGKDTLAAQLVNAHGFTRIGFADPLKAAALDLDPWVWVEPDETGKVYGPGVSSGPPRHRLSSIVSAVGWETAKECREVRRVLQALGVAVRDHVSSSAWVDAALAKADEIPGPVVIPDVRFPNEVAAIRDQHWAGNQLPPHRGRMVRVYRPGLPEVDLHTSETALDDFVPDYLVVNDRGVQELRDQADAIARSVLGQS